MPLIVLTGHPCSGKTHRATQLLVDFRARIANAAESAASANSSKREVILLASHHASLDPQTPSEADYSPPTQSANPRDQIYSVAATEKTARAEEFSTIKRALSKNNVVIADGLNYIKGFRYQIWCEAKATGTRCVVVHAAAREDECESWNHDRLQAWGWESQSKAAAAKDGEDMLVGGVNVRVGRNVFGELEPESHTAIYGDKIVDYGNGGSRSRSSSMGGGVSGDEDESSVSQRRLQATDDSMTLKSLYISNKEPEPRDISRRKDDNNRNSIKNTQSLRQDLEDHVPIDVSQAPNTPLDPKSSLPYSTSTLKSLLMRYEPPSPFTRWDTPLFTIPSQDAHVPYEAIWNAIFPPATKSTSKKALSQMSHKAGVVSSSLARSEKKSTDLLDETPQPSVKPHAATVLPQATSAEALQILESATSEVVRAILQAARDQDLVNGEGGELTFTLSPTNIQKGTPAPSTNLNDQEAETTTFSIDLPPNTPLSQPMLQRLRRKYTQIQRGSIAHGKGYAVGRIEVLRGFVAFLDAEWSE